MNLRFLPIFVLPILVFWGSFNYYFFQDDWFILNWITNNNLSSFFSFRSDIVYWRPLSIPLYFWLSNKFFNLNPLGFHLVAFMLFFLLIFAVYKLFLILFEDKRIGISIVILYSIWPIHFISLSWLAATQYIMAPLMIVASLILLIKFSQKSDSLSIIFSYFFYFLGLLSHEIVSVTPFLFLGLLWVNKKLVNLKPVLPMVVASIAFLVIRLNLAPIDFKNEYQVLIGSESLSSFIWYFLWSFNLPESFRELIHPNLPSQSLKVLRQFWWISTSSILLFTIFFVLLLHNVKKNFKYFKYYLFGAYWFILSILPYLFIPKHAFPMYLSLAGIGILYMVAINFQKKNGILLNLFLFLWIVSALSNLQFTKATHWLINEQSISRSYTDYVRELVIKPSNNSIFLFQKASESFQKNHQFVLTNYQNSLHQSLNGNDAVQVIYNDTSLKSFYNGEKLKVWKNLTIYEIDP